MKKHIPLSLLLLTLSLFGFSQQKVVLQSNGSTQIFGGTTPFIDAYEAAVDGDTIYLSGILFSTPSSFDKQIVIYGTGVYADSTQVTGISRIASVTFNAGSQNSRIEGVRIEGNIVFQANQKIDNIYIEKCHITGYISIPGTTGPYSDGTIISRSIIDGYISAENAQNIIIRNNIFHSNTSRTIRNVSRNAWIANNIIIGYAGSSEVLFTVSESLFENNIIYNTWTSTASPISTSVINNTFNNNCFRVDPTTNTLNTWSNNYINTLIGNVLIDYINKNYHLVDPDNFVGTTGNEIGVYGGLFPLKDGAVPSNPHIRSKNIAPGTNEDGDLEVQIEVGAQAK